ncbi:hypothetical protein [Motilibacter aurantiacus]|uniref:hypothetical protein n=1 Tax=Motilibacter aurantiacus TaxID=2714955 RepID=UPI00140BD00E|nr:hypothetical protein [Motilibacter aurantiacus]NHC45892.1 hypothetical protein [Motilibacter aurantiacus]
MRDERPRRLALDVLGNRWDLELPPGRVGDAIADVVGDLLVGGPAGDDRAQAPPAQRTWSLRAAPGASGVEGWELASAGRRLLWSPRPDTLAVDALRLLNSAAIEAEATFSVHAAVLALDGRAAVLPADSGTGKTTFCAAALRAGLTYLTDEAARFPDASSARVLGYPRPLSLHRASQALLGLEPSGVSDATEGLYRASALGPVGRAPESRVAVIALLDRRPGPTRLEAIPRSAAAELLLRQSFNHYRDPRGAFLRATRLAAAATTWALGYEEAPQAVGLLRQALAEPPPTR